MSPRIATGATTRKPADAIDLLTADHKAIESLFGAFEDAGEHHHRTRATLVERMITELIVHTAVEEAVLYPVARAEDPGSEADVLEALEEHHVVAWQLRELEGLDPEHERFAAKVSVMMENVRHHVCEEEDTLFPALRTHLSRSRLVELGMELQRVRSLVSIRPLPRLWTSAPLSDGLVSDAVAHVVERAWGLACAGRS